MAARGQTLAAVAAKLEEADGCGGHKDELVDTKAFLTAAPLGPRSTTPFDSTRGSRQAWELEAMPALPSP